MESINLERLLLASQSPRRKELLEQTGIKLQVVHSDIEEEKISIKNPEEYVATLAFLKTEKVSEAYPEFWVIGADTIVVIQDQILGKPASEDHAIEMLKLLSN